MVPEPGLDAEGARSNPNDLAARGIQAETERAADQLLIDALPFPVYESYEECSTVRAVWTPGWTPVPGGHSARFLVPQTKRGVTGNVLKVRIWTEEFSFEVEARLGNDAVDGPAHGDSRLPQRAEQARCSNVAIHRRFDHRQGHENSLSLPEMLLGPKALKDFRDDDRKDCQVLLFVQSGVESLYVRSQGPVEEVCPRAGVDDDHPRVVRADLHPAISPSHESFPFRRRNAR